MESLIRITSCVEMFAGEFPCNLIQQKMLQSSLIYYGSLNIYTNSKPKQSSFGWLEDSVHFTIHVESQTFDQLSGVSLSLVDHDDTQTASDSSSTWNHASPL